MITFAVIAAVYLIVAVIEYRSVRNSPYLVLPEAHNDALFIAVLWPLVYLLLGIAFTAAIVANAVDRVCKP